MSEEHSEDRSVVSDLCTLLQSGEGADVTLVVGGSELQAHGLILAARSPVFAAALRHDMKEARSRRIEITDMQEEVLKELLLFLYGDKTPQLATMTRELLAAAEKYDLPVLKKRCEQQMMRDICVENAATTVALAMQYSCPELRNAAAQFIVSHPEVLATDGWDRVLRDSADAAAEVCRQMAVALTRPPQKSQPKTEKETSTFPQSQSRFISEEHKRNMGDRLRGAACDGKVREVWALLAAGAPRDGRDGSGNTALHLSAKNGHASTVKCLLDGGLDVNVVNSSKQTPLHVAAHTGDTTIIWMLLKMSASVDAQDNRGQTPLHVAALKEVMQNSGNSYYRSDCDKCGSIPKERARATVIALLLAGAKKDILDVANKTPEEVSTSATKHAFISYCDL